MGVLGTLQHRLDEIMTSMIQRTYYYKLFENLKKLICATSYTANPEAMSESLIFKCYVNVSRQDFDSRLQGWKNSY